VFYYRLFCLSGEIPGWLLFRLIRFSDAFLVSRGGPDEAVKIESSFSKQKSL
jgi:hypothetical protein